MVMTTSESTESKKTGNMLRLKIWLGFIVVMAILGVLLVLIFTLAYNARQNGVRTQEIQLTCVKAGGSSINIAGQRPLCLYPKS